MPVEVVTAFVEKAFQAQASNCDKGELESVYDLVPSILGHFQALQPWVQDGLHRLQTVLHNTFVQHRISTRTDDDFPDSPIFRMAIDLPEMVDERTNLGGFDQRGSFLSFKALPYLG